MFGIFEKKFMKEQNQYTRKKEPELNRQLIIDAATNIGAESDWSQVTFQAIADRTGLSKGGIIHHFRNKEELLDQLLNEGFMELTDWVERYKKNHADKEGAFGYLDFVLNERKNDKYRKTMRVVLQAIMANPKYSAEWDKWYNKHIMPKGEEISTKSLIICLIADGIWFGENMNSKAYSKKDKERIIDYVKQL